MPLLEAVVALGLISLASAGFGRWAGAVWFGDGDRTLLALAAPVLGLALFALASLLLLLIGGAPLSLHVALPMMGLILGWRGRNSVVEDWRTLKTELGDSAGAVLGLAALTAVFLLVLGAGPVVDWDSLTFHDRVMRQFLGAGRIFLPEDNLHVAQLGLAQLASSPLRVVGVESAGALISILAALLAVVAGAIAAGRIAGPLAARLAAAAITGTPLLLLVAATPRVDAPLTLALLLAMFAIASDIKDGVAKRANWSLALIGIAAGTKYHGIAFGALLAIPLAWILWTTKTFRLVAKGLVFAVLAVSPWLVLNQIHFGAPLFPFLAPLVLEPWLASVVGSRLLPEGSEAGWAHLMSSARERFNPLYFIFSPQRLTLESEGAWYRPSLLLLLVPLALFARPRRVMLLWCGVPLAYVAIVFLISPATSPRYLLPAVASLLVGTAAGIAFLLRNRDEGGRPVIGWALALLALGQTLVFAPGWLTPGVVGYAVGQAPAREFRVDHPDVTVRRFAGISAMVDSVVPLDGTVLMLFDGRGGAFDRRMIADSRGAFWPVLEQAGAVNTCIAGTGVTHVLLNAGALDYYLARGSSSVALRVDELRGFFGRCTILKTQQAGFLLAELRPVDPTRRDGP